MVLLKVSDGRRAVSCVDDFVSERLQPGTGDHGHGPGIVYQ